MSEGGGPKSIFDEEGENSSYFLLTILVLYLIVATYKLFLSQGPEREGIPKDGLKFRNLSFKKLHNISVKKRKQSPVGYIVYFAVLAAAVALVIHISSIDNKDFDDQHFDPYRLLGVSEDATDKMVKKAFRKWSKELHPDRNPSEDAEKKFVQITKAYQTLTDEKALNNWKEFGHPDGQQAHDTNFAIPSFLVSSEYRYFTVFGYFLAFMMIAPTFVATTWWNSRRFMDNHIILRQTCGLFFKYTFAEFPFEAFLQIVSASVEYEELVPLSTDAEEVKELEEIIRDYGLATGHPKINAPYTIKSKALFAAHLYRHELKNKTLLEQQQHAISLVPDLIQYGMLPVLGSKAYKNALLTAMQFNQSIIQGMNPSQIPPLAMLPHIVKEMFVPDDHECIPAQPTLSAFHAMSRDDKRKWLKELSDEKFDEVLTVAENIPSLAIDIHMGVNDEEQVTAKSIVTITLDLERITTKENLLRRAEVKAMKEAGEVVFKKYSPGLLKREEKTKAKRVVDPDDSDDEGEEWLNQVEKANQRKAKKFEDPKSPVIHCPRFPGTVYETWWVVLSNPKKEQLIVLPKLVDDLTDRTEVEIIFQAPAEPGKYEYDLDIVSNGYCGLVFSQKLAFDVHEQVEVPKTHYEDEAEEEEEDEEELEESSEEESDLASDSE